MLAGVHNIVIDWAQEEEGLVSPASWSEVGISRLDLKLGIRMLVKHPWLTLVVVFALGIGIPASLAPHHLIDAVLDESPPFDEGEQVVGVVGRNQESGRQEALRLGDYESLRTRLTSFASVGAALLRDVNVISDDGRAEGARGAEMSASSFALTRVPPARGRALTAADEVVGAPEVVVVGHDYWRSRLGARSDVVGSTLRIGGVPTTVVGVMPEGFAMPSREQLWLPLRRRAIDYADGLGPAVWVYGRLEEGTSRGEARAELAAVGIRRDVPDDRGRVRADAVVPRDRRAHRPRREVEPDRRGHRASTAPPAHGRGRARHRVLGCRLHVARRGRRVPGRARGRGAVVADGAVPHGRDRRDDRPAGLPRAHPERAQDSPGGGATRRRVVGGEGCEPAMRSANLPRASASMVRL